MENFDHLNSPKSFMKAEEKVKMYNEKNQSELCWIFHLDDGNYIVAVVDNLSGVHEVVPQAGVIVFVDATPNLKYDAPCNYPL